MENQIEKQIEMKAPQSRVWQALTDARQFGQWFGVALEGDFVTGKSVGGNLAMKGYEHIRMEVTVTAINPESYFAYTWHPYAVDPKIDYTHETPTLVEFRLEKKGASTVLVVTESGFDKLPPERYADALRMNTRGWEGQLKKIDAYVSAA